MRDISAEERIAVMASLARLAATSIDKGLVDVPLQTTEIATVSKDKLAAKYPHYNILRKPLSGCPVCHSSGETKDTAIDKRGCDIPCICVVCDLSDNEEELMTIAVGWAALSQMQKTLAS